ncbi:hypothetical protein TWF694_005088 [Orbilia ellipsospora]|uniref:CAP-Gly domain-containing protein n=1 Tax=Orbilia ellipsospora TaxID=2528407 RepID=A0AAV9WUQ0_9PEZI
MTTPTTPTPRRSLARLRPSAMGTPNVPAIPPPLLSPETLLARKQSFNQLNQNSSSSKDSGYGGDSDGGLEIGDKVNVPGGMYGVVKFVGTVKGKPGVFVGVELEGPHAVNGKNDGTVEGTRYFTTSVPHSGIFLPLSRAVLRHSGSSVKSGSDTPSVVTSPADPPSLSPLQPPKKPFGRPSLPRPQSPAQRNVTPRPGLLPQTPQPRSGSSLSNRMFSPSPTPGMGRNRGVSVSSNGGGMMGEATPGARRAPSQTPRALRPGFNAQKPLPQPARAGSSLSFTETSPIDDQSTPRANGHAHASNNSIHSHTGSTGSSSTFVAKMTRLSREDGISREEEDKGMIAVLQAQLSAKDHQLKEQANNLLEMESSLNELQSLLSEGVAAAQQQQAQAQQNGAGAGVNGRTLPRKGSAGMMSVNSGDGEEELELAQLRHLLRERNERISQLQVDFDAHRADFRSTIDTLEMAATETEKIYEKKVEDLLAELREVERQRVELMEDRVRREEMGENGVEGVARQLKSLEELVAELEEGLEDARRGESEARAEAEHCRGESERLKEELRREKEKVGAFERRVEDLKEQVKSGEGEVEKKNDEIRGLKAIMTSLSRKPPAAASANNGNIEEEKAARKRLEERVKDLEGLLDRKNTREEQLEREVETLKHASSGLKISMPIPLKLSSSIEEPKSLQITKDATRGVRSASNSLRRIQDSPALTDIDDDEELVLNGGGPPPPPKKDLPALPPKDTKPVDATPYCDLCEKSGHDILSCTEMFAGKASKKDSVATFTTLEKAGMTPLPLNTGGVVGRSSLEEADDRSGNGGGVSLNRAVTPNPPMKEEETDANGLPAVAGKSSGVVDRGKWCALCERDGHDSVDCPLDDF